MMSNLEIQLAVRPSGSRIVALRGPVTLETLFELQNVLRQERSDLIIDLAGVPYMDSAGLGAILTAYASCQRHQHKFGLANISQRVLVLLQVTKVDTLLPIYASVEAAEGQSAASA
jgi:anti-sigma B factor antagonist